VDLPTRGRRDQLTATFVPLAGLVALFFGLVAALVVAGLDAHLLPPIHPMRTRHRHRSPFA
jgi:hypothetical protein